MAQIDQQLSTGLGGLDHVLKGLIPGDNIVWQVDSIADYRLVVEPYCRGAVARGERLIYFRFARHEPIVPDDVDAEVHRLHPEESFEQFIAEVHRVIEQVGRGGFYVFDCLSDLAVDWYSDQMLGNFFMLTCPYLLDVQAIAYFALLRNHHSQYATTPIADTTQILLDVYRHQDRFYVQPLKVQQRYSPTMYLLHEWPDLDLTGEFVPVTRSAEITEILTSAPWARTISTRDRFGVWRRTLLEAEEMVGELREGQYQPEQADELFRRLLRMMISREERVGRLAERYMSLADIVDVGRRMIGTGLIGGKAVGMLLARAIVRRDRPRLHRMLEGHDSFFIGSDVFYTFLVRNGLWYVRKQQKDPERFLEGAENARQRMLGGNFPDYIVQQFSSMLDYFGQSPIIVRSSSLLEDNFGSAFSGKYESVFCANQGPRRERLDDFLTAVRTIYASAMSEKALRYRARRGLLQEDEQMALLVQRVSGAMYGNMFYPQAAGVAYSFNPYAWSPDIDPAAGMLRLVFGMGTRAVDRHDDDYTRVVALNAPERRPEADFEEVREFAQRKVDVLDLESNQLVSRPFSQVASQASDLPLELFASRDEEMVRRAAERNVSDVFPWVLTFEKLFAETDFVGDMREMVRCVHDAYDYPVDIEFTTNFFGDAGGFKVNLVQCRPLQVATEGGPTRLPANLRDRDKLLTASGAVIGPSRAIDVARLVYVVPSLYGKMPVSDRHRVARVVGRAVHALGGDGHVLLLGPGRWGTTTPSLGVPVNFSDINRVSALCEIVAMREDLVPDVSLGTHFFNDLVEMDILYMALFPKRPGNALNEEAFTAAPNRLAELVPEEADRADAVRVIDATDLADGRGVTLNADAVNQQVVIYIEPEQ